MTTSVYTGVVLKELERLFVVRSKYQKPSSYFWGDEAYIDG